MQVKTPPDVKELQGGEGDEGDGSPKSVWCQWGGQMVPCAPGYGGAWVDPGQKHLNGGIWPLDEEKEEKEPEEAYTGDATHVKAGHRLLSLFRQPPPPPPLRPGVECLLEPQNM